MSANVIIIGAGEPFELLQTLRLHDGVLPASSLHLDRMEAAARHFGYAFDRSATVQVLRDVAGQHAQGDWRVRLLCDAQGALRCEALSFVSSAETVNVVLAETPIEAPEELLRFKTTRRNHYERFSPSAPGVFDTLLWNARGEITEFTRGSVIAELTSGRLVTPPLRCGLLDGVGRALALQSGRVGEAVVRLEDLPRLRSLHFVNALRGELKIREPDFRQRRSVQHGKHCGALENMRRFNQ